MRPCHDAPVILSTRAIASPLAFGNPVVLKASEKCPRVHAAVIGALNDAGFPAGVVNLVIHSAADAPEVIDELIAHPATRRVNFTGSTKVGRIVAAKCAKHLKPSLLELGGKAPMVVLSDADLDEAAAAASFGAFMNSGQICMSTERIVADVAVAGQLASKLAERAQALTTGDPRDEGTMVGPLVDDAGREHVLELLEDARAKGATVLTGGEDRGNNVVTPAVVVGVTPGMRLYGEESFGPVVAVIDAQDADDAVRIANDSPYGCPPPCSPATRPRASTSPGGSSPASATSTARPCTTSRRCRSAASRRRAGGASAAPRRCTSSPTCAGSRSSGGSATTRSRLRG
jgi:acyl-CoA reductase-like NAD-dependent aldehyde dehydrogenase